MIWNQSTWFDAVKHGGLLIYRQHQAFMIKMCSSATGLREEWDRLGFNMRASEFPFELERDNYRPNI